MESHVSKDQEPCCRAAEELRVATPCFAPPRRRRCGLRYRRAPARYGPHRSCPFGPYKTHEDFRCSLRAQLPLGLFEFLIHRGHPIFVSHSKGHSSKFTHGDFISRNMIVKKDGTVMGIIDRECAGWYLYWEYTKAHSWPRAPRHWRDRAGEMTRHNL